MTFSAKDYLNQMNLFYHKQAFYEDKLNVEFTSYKVQPIYEYSAGFYALSNLKANANSLSLQANSLNCINHSLNMFGYLMKIQADLLVPNRTINHLNKDLTDAYATLLAAEKQLDSSDLTAKKHLSQLNNNLISIQSTVKSYTDMNALTTSIRSDDFQKIETSLNEAASHIYHTVTYILSQETD